MTGRYAKTCAYCGAEFRTDIEYQRYCKETHKTYDYRRRRAERSAEKTCLKCGKPWTEPRASSTGRAPKYCARCQDYYTGRYNAKEPTE